jgi:vitamin B12 transporter
VHWETFAFGSSVRELIQYQQAGQGVQRARNIGQARVVGVESSVRLEWAEHLRLGAQATWTDARDTSMRASARGKHLPLRPAYRGHVRPELRAVPLSGTATGAVYAELDLTDGNYLDPANLVRMQRRVLLGAGASIDGLFGRWRLVLSARNLLDSRIHDLAGYPLPGRTLFATLGLGLGP